MARLRIAEPADLDEITKMVIDTMPSDPQWNYRMVHREEFPEDHYKYTRMLYEQFIDTENDDWCVLIVDVGPNINEVVGLAEQATTVAKSLAQGQEGYPNAAGRGSIVAFAVWDISFINKRKHGPSYQKQDPRKYVFKHGGSTRRDVDPKRQKAFVESASKSANYFTKYADDQIKLQILGTRPEHRRHGYASYLCQCGMMIASMEELVVTLVAGAMGVLLYTHLDFASLGEFVVQVPGEEEKVISTAMVFDPKKRSTE